MGKKTPLNLIIFVALYTIMFGITTYMIIWQQLQGFIVVKQFILIAFALICLIADIVSIRQIILLKKENKKENTHE